MGRIRKKAADRMTELLVVRITRAERKLLREMAATSGKRVSAFVRSRLLEITA